MYAFKAERPDAARRYHSKFVSGTNYQESSNRRFALSKPTENILRSSILESGWLINNITFVTLMLFQVMPLILEPASYIQDEFTVADSVRC